ncbi:choice-of-anchor I family protein [Metabacillus sp. HB246100]
MKNLVKKTIVGAVASWLLMSPISTYGVANLSQFSSEEGEGVHVELIGRYTSGAEIGQGGTEIVAYDKENQHVFSINGDQNAVEILDLSQLKDGKQEIPLLKQITLADLGVSASDVTSVAIHPDGQFFAVSAPSVNKVDPGFVVFLSLEGDYLSSVQVGSLPDMITFTPDGAKLLVANEGEPNDEYTVNPEGSISVIDVKEGLEGLTNASVSTIRFTDDVIDSDVRKVREDHTYAENLEPEYIVIDEKSQFAYVALQENNAIAKIDIANQKVLTVKSLGYKDYSITENQLDASNKDDEINIQNWPVLSMYQPDGLASYTVDNKTYILSANEGDSQNYKGFSEEERVNDLKDNYELNADLFEGYTQEMLDKMILDGLFEDDQLGRLLTTSSAPQNMNNKYEAIYSFGARSFSIWDAHTLNQVYDSGSDFENITSTVYGKDFFNSNNDENAFDSRSDDKGPEPESVIVGKVQGQNYAFIGLERVGGIMMYDISNPEAPKFTKYFSSRIFTTEKDVTLESRDSAPEGLTFIPAEFSPTGQNLLLAAHEITGTIAAYQVGIEVPDEPVDNSNEDSDEETDENSTPPPSSNPNENSNDQSDSKENPFSDQESVNEHENVLNEEEVTSESKENIANVNDVPKIEEINNKMATEGHKLPNTATKNDQYFVIGLLIFIIGFYFKRKGKLDA